jgi:hypothetical protein
MELGQGASQLDHEAAGARTEEVGKVRGWGRT